MEKILPLRVLLRNYFNRWMQKGEIAGFPRQVTKVHTENKYVAGKGIIYVQVGGSSRSLSWFEAKRKKSESKEEK